jgi:CheY-like chemotaxis protein
MAKTKMLIVEDEVLVALALSKEFEGLGYDMCKPVFSGEGAIEAVERKRPDVVLMDIKLPGKIDGIEAAQKIRSRFRIPIVFITGYEDPEIEERANAVEHIGYFLKPLNCREIQEAIDAALQKQKGIPKN